MFRGRCSDECRLTSSSITEVTHSPDIITLDPRETSDETKCRVRCMKVSCQGGDEMTMRDLTKYLAEPFPSRLFLLLLINSPSRLLCPMSSTDDSRLRNARETVDCESQDAYRDDLVDSTALYDLSQLLQTGKNASICEWIGRD